jgi:hypothetical protein
VAAISVDNICPPNVQKLNNIKRREVEGEKIVIGFSEVRCLGFQHAISVLLVI